MEQSLEGREVFFKWAAKEFEVAIRQMFAEKSTVHMFDFDGTTAGFKEPWSFLIAIAPKKSFAEMERKFKFNATTSGERPDRSDIPPEVGSPNPK